jgi:hypothetical protein
MKLAGSLDLRSILEALLDAFGAMVLAAVFFVLIYALGPSVAQFAQEVAP